MERKQKVEFIKIGGETKKNTLTEQEQLEKANSKLRMQKQQQTNRNKATLTKWPPKKKT